MCNPTSCTWACPRNAAAGKELCVCDDDAGRLLALMAEGISQRHASLMLWAPHLLRTSRLDGREAYE